MIALSQQEKTILSLIEPVADGLGMEIVRVRLMGGKRPTLQIMAEKAGGAPTNGWVTSGGWLGTLESTK